jgi:hypothetical protein
MTVDYADMKVPKNPILAIRCPTCGAKPGEKCELSTGQPRTTPHRERRLSRQRSNWSRSIPSGCTLVIHDFGMISRFHRYNHQA